MPATHAMQRKPKSPARKQSDPRLACKPPVVRPLPPPPQEEVEAQAVQLQQLEQRLATQQRRLELIAQQQQHSRHGQQRAVGARS